MKIDIMENAIVGGDHRRRYYLSVTVSAHGFGAVFFQLTAGWGNFGGQQTDWPP